LPTHITHPYLGYPRFVLAHPVTVCCYRTSHRPPITHTFGLRLVTPLPSLVFEHTAIYPLVYCLPHTLPLPLVTLLDNVPLPCYAYLCPTVQFSLLGRWFGLPTYPYALPSCLPLFGQNHMVSTPCCIYSIPLLLCLVFMTAHCGSTFVARTSFTDTPHTLLWILPTFTYILLHTFVWFLLVLTFGHSVHDTLPDILFVPYIHIYPAILFPGPPTDVILVCCTFGSYFM